MAPDMGLVCHQGQSPSVMLLRSTGPCPGPCPTYQDVGVHKSKTGACGGFLNCEKVENTEGTPGLADLQVQTDCQCGFRSRFHTPADALGLTASC